MDAVSKFKGLLRGSNLGACPRRLGYQATTEWTGGARDDDAPSENPRFDDGHWHEFDIKRRMGAAGVVFESGITRIANVRIDIDYDWTIAGHLDGVVVVDDSRTAWLPDGRFILEAKSMAPGSFWRFIKSRYREGFPSYFDQIQGYLHSVTFTHTPMSEEHTPVKALYDGLWAHEASQPSYTGPTPDHALITAKNKETGRIYSEVVERDDTHWEGLQRRWRVARDCVASGTLPDRLYEDSNNFECGDCPFKTECWSEGVEVIPVQALVTPEASDAAKLFTVGKALEKLSEQMIDAAIPALRPDALGKYEVGGVKINKYETKSVVWDHKRLERELPRDYLAEVRVEGTRETVRRDVPKLSVEELRALIVELQGGASPLLLAGG